MEEGPVVPHQSRQPEPRFNKYALLCALLASTNSILLGYDIGVMSGAVLLIEEDLHITSVQVEILVGSLNVFSLIGSLASGKTSDIIGRRFTIVLAASTFLIGALLTGLAPSFALLFAGRAVAGVGVGYALMISPLYSAEISPANSRGLLTSLPEVFIVTGILIGYIINYALTSLPVKLGWRVMLGGAAIPAGLIGLGVIFMPESPRWLIMKNRNEQAKRVLLRISDDPQEAEFRLQDIIKAATGDPNATDEKDGGGVWKDLILRPTRSVRRILIAAIGINFFMQASGNDAVMYYLPAVFHSVGIKNKRKLFGINVIMGLSKASFVLMSAIFSDRFGRRPLLLIGTTGMAVSLCLLGAGSRVLEHSDKKPLWATVTCIVAVCADVSFFSIGLGPMTWVYSSEIFPLRLRAQGTGLAVSVNRLVSGVVSMSFLSASKKMSFGGVFFTLSGIMVLAFVFCYVFLPETKGKTLEEIHALFDGKKHDGAAAADDDDDQN